MDEIGGNRPTDPLDGAWEIARHFSHEKLLRIAVAAVYYLESDVKSLTAALEAYRVLQREVGLD